MIRRFTHVARRLIRHTATDWKYPFYKAYTPLWRFGMARRGVDLTHASYEEMGVKPDIASVYETSEPSFLAEVLRRLEIGADDAILDYGAGKGGALIVLRGFPFRKIGGVDLSPRMLETARKNFARLGMDGIELVCENAATYADLDEYNYFYFFNPFPEEVMREALRNIHESARRRPRQTTLIYCNPRCHDMLVSDPAIRFEWSYFNISVYSLAPSLVASRSVHARP